MQLASQSPAPSFQALDHNGQEHTLEGYAGRWVILYFYPKDGTPGCTTEACSFRDHYPELSQVAVVLGVSADSADSHTKFATTHQLPFPLLVDTDRSMIRAYGADGILFPKRVTFLIDPTGKIAKVYRSIDVQQHAQQILQDILAKQE